MTRVETPDPIRAVLDDEMAVLAALPHRLWSGLARTSRTAVRRGSNGRTYRVAVDARPDPADPDSILVTVRVQPTGWFAGGSVSARFTSRPEGPAGGLEPPDSAG